jgi:sulfite exporter TauE/SafE
MFEEYVVSNWPLVVVSLILAGFGQTVKGTLFTKENIQKYHGKMMGEVIWWGRKTLPQHPVLIGALLGFVPGMPVPEFIATTAAKVTYFAGAGMSSTWMFNVIKQLLKEKGIELDSPSIVPSSPLPPPPAN